MNQQFNFAFKPHWHILIGMLLLSASLILSSDVIAQETSSGKSNYEIGVQAFKQGDYRRAFDAWSLGAYEENAEAQYNLGVLYLEGRGVERDAQQARAWFMRAAEKNQLEAQYNLGHMALSGISVEKNVKEALKWWKSASNGGYPQAQFNYGRALYLGIGDRKDIKQGLLLIRLAAAKNDQRAQAFLTESAQEIEEYDRALAEIEVDFEGGASNSKNTPPRETKLAADPKSTNARATSKSMSPSVSGRKRDVLSTSNQVIALAQKVLDEPKMSRKAAQAALSRQVPEPEIEVRENQVIALAPAPDTKTAPENVQTPGAKPVQISKKPIVQVAANQVIALDDSTPEPVVRTSPPSRSQILTPTPERQPQHSRTRVDNNVRSISASSSLERDQFLRTQGRPVKVYASSNLTETLDTLVPNTVVKVIARQTDNVQIEIAPGLPAWVKRVEVQLQDGYASPAQNSVALYTHPEGRVMGELSKVPPSLIIEQRRKWLKLRVTQTIYGWIKAQALEDSGESEQRLIVEWVRETQAIKRQKTWPNTPGLQTVTAVSKPVEAPLTNAPVKQVTPQAKIAPAPRSVMTSIAKLKTVIAKKISPNKVAPKTAITKRTKEVVKSSTQAATSTPINDNSWLFSQPDNAYVIHLFTVQDHASALKIANRLSKSSRNRASVHLYTTRVKGDDWSFVLLGSYPDEQSALAALAAMPKKSTRGSKVRKLSLIASNRCAKRQSLSVAQANGLSGLCL